TFTVPENASAAKWSTVADGDENSTVPFTVNAPIVAASSMSALPPVSTPKIGTVEAAEMVATPPSVTSRSPIVEGSATVRAPAPHVPLTLTSSTTIASVLFPRWVRVAWPADMHVQDIVQTRTIPDAVSRAQINQDVGA